MLAAQMSSGAAGDIMTKGNKRLKERHGLQIRVGWDSIVGFRSESLSTEAETIIIALHLATHKPAIT